MNNKFCIFIFTILLTILPLQSVFADAYSDQSFIADDSCVEGASISNALINNITTLGLFTAYSANFYIEGAPVNDPNNLGQCDPNYYNGFLHDAKGCASNEVNCSSNCDPKGGMRMCYRYLAVDLSYQYSCQNVRDGFLQVYLVPPATIYVSKIGDKLCAMFWTAIGFQSIGCKYLPDCSKFALDSSCYVAKSCSSTAAQHSRSLLPIAGSIIECIKESIERLFTDFNGCPAGDSTYHTNYFPVFQNTMRSAVRAALMLYIVLFGIKIALGGEMPHKGEFFSFGAKFILVMYFSVGIYTSSDSNGKPVYDDGVTTIMQPFFQNGSSSLANIVYSAGGSQGLCVYNTADYPSDSVTGADYSYLALWDSIDCRILYYLGFDIARVYSQSSSGAILIGTAVGGFSLFVIPIAALFGFDIIFAVFCVAFLLFFISVIIYFVNITVLSMIALAILIYMAPIFVPMALFHPTKSYYDGWLKLMISYALQPMIVAAYIAMMLTIFDQTIFGDCQFISTNIETIDGQQTSGTPNKSLPFFVLCDPDNPQPGCFASGTIDANTTKCKDTIGYKISRPLSDFITNKTQIFFQMPVLNGGVSGDMLAGLVTLCLFGFLFYKFADMLSQFAAELTGGPALGNLAGHPMQLVNMAMNAATSAATGKPPAAAAASAAASSGANVSASGGGGANVSASTPRAGAGAGTGGGGAAS